ncbi:MAG: hypothetical protein HW374_1999 [Bacteroidetes bacterium]|nr:hypothetical protein [Bacteroidota bacterium]
MKSIESMIGRELQWVHPSIFKRTYELRAGDIVVARMEWKKFFAMEAKAESADGCWNFEQKGILKSEVAVRLCDSKEPLAIFQETRFKKEQKLSLPHGRFVTLKPNFWRTTYTLASETGEPLVILKKHAFFSSRYDVELRRKGGSFPEFPWLVLLMWFIVLVTQARSRAAAG